MKRALVDTSAWYALVDRRDPDHLSVSAVLREWSGRRVLTNFVLDETLTLLRYRLGHAPARAFGEVLGSGEVASIVRVGRMDEARAWEIFCRYRDKSFSFTDCTSFAVIERLRLDCAVALDENFRAYGIRCLP